MPEHHHLQPLAVRMRPATLDQVVGQDHLLAQGCPLRRMVERRALRSMIFWGPPGVGETTIAQLLAASVGAQFVQLSAISAGVKDVRAVLEQGKAMQREGQQLVLFLHEIHRFNKAQQDALLQGVQEAWVTLIGATTENPSFEVIAPLLSAARSSNFTPFLPRLWTN